MTTPISGALRRGLRGPLLPDLLLALFACAIAASVYLSHYGVGNALSSDNVMPYVLFDDLFRRGVGLRGFLWPESPFYFPDTLLAWAIYAVCGSLTGAVTLYAWIHSTLFVLLVRAVLRRAGVGTDQQTRAAWLIPTGTILSSLLLIQSPAMNRPLHLQALHRDDWALVGLAGLIVGCLPLLRALARPRVGRPNAGANMAAGP